MGITINANLIVIILVGLLFLCYFIDNRAYKKGFDDGLKIGKMIGKADMVAMLEEIQLEIEEIVKEEGLIDKTWANGLHYSEKIIQQKINSLKETKDDKDR